MIPCDFHFQVLVSFYGHVPLALISTGWNVPLCYLTFSKTMGGLASSPFLRDRTLEIHRTSHLWHPLNVLWCWVGMEHDFTCASAQPWREFCCLPLSFLSPLQTYPEVRWHAGVSWAFLFCLSPYSSWRTFISPKRGRKKSLVSKILLNLCGFCLNFCFWKLSNSRPLMLVPLGHPLLRWCEPHSLLLDWGSPWGQKQA